MKWMDVLKAVTIATVWSAAPPSHAGEWKPGISVVTDRTFRGISQTDGKPGIAGEVLWEPVPGSSLGIWVATLDYAGIPNPVELNYFATVGTSVGATQVTGGYIYRHRPGRVPLSYGEITGTVSHKVGPGRVSASAYYSPDHFLGGSSIYASVTGAVPLGTVGGLPLRTDLTVGRSTFSKPAGNYSDARLRFLTRYGGLGLAASVSVADLPRRSLLPGRDRAGTRVAFTVLKAF